MMRFPAAGFALVVVGYMLAALAAGYILVPERTPSNEQHHHRSS